MLGCVAILVPAVAAVGTAIFIGWLLLFVGAVLVAGGVLRALDRDPGLADGLGDPDGGRRRLADRRPVNGTLTLTLVLGIYFLFMGLTRTTIAFIARGEPNAGLLGLSGVAGLLIGILILAEFPSSADWAIGLLVGIDLIFAGWTLTSVALSAKTSPAANAPARVAGRGEPSLQRRESPSP